MFFKDFWNELSDKITKNQQVGIIIILLTIFVYLLFKFFTIKG
jgi:hypothetical protein